MIRTFQLADWFTLANAASGMVAVFAGMRHLQSGEARDVLVGCLAILAALVFDVLDGRVARWRQSASALGRELDSLSDVISFGVAPAVLAHAAGMDGLLDRIVLVYFVACGVSRLARFNVTAEQMTGDSGKVSHFEGTPIPTSIVLVAVLALAAWQGALDGALWGGTWSLGGLELHPLVLLWAVSGTLMISRVRIPKW